MATAPELEPATPPIERSKPVFLSRVKICGYKSIAVCDVTLEPLTLLVGRNASGKSNFLDALAFLADAARFNLTQAVYIHGGPSAILCRSTTTRDVQFELDYVVVEEADTYDVTYQLHFSITADGVPERVGEGLRTKRRGKNSKTTTPRSLPSHEMLTTEFTWQSRQPPHHLGLPHGDGAAGRLLTERIVNLRVYNFNPEIIRRPQRSKPGGFLERDGSNLASILRATNKHDRSAIERIGRYFHVITESVELGEVAEYGEYETVRFRVQRSGDDQPLEFDAASMSDGTLRALAALVAAYQSVEPHGRPSLIAIEEPETSLHPAAMRALVDALDEATLRTQILLTTHSAEMLDNPTIRPENVRVVEMLDGETVIAPVDAASVEIVQQKLDTLGGLERQNQLQPDRDDLDRQRHLSKNGQEPKG